MRLLLLLALTVPLTVAGAQEPLTGVILVDPGLVVNEGEVLVLGPGAVLTGPGRVEVRGTLDARGDPARPVQLAVPLVLLGNGSATLRHVRAWGVDAAALVVDGGTLVLEDVLVEGNGVGIRAEAGLVVAANVTLRDHADAAVQLGPGATATLQGMAFATNARHIDANGSRLTLDRARLDAPPGAAPALHARDADVRTRNVTFEGGEVAVRLEGAASRYASEDDAFLGGRVGLRVEAGEANLTRPRFETTRRDVDAGPDATLRFTDARFTPSAVAVPAPPPAPGGVSAWWVLAGGLTVAAGGVVLARLRPMARPPPPLPEPAPAVLPAAPPPDLSAPLTDIERRILRDIAAHPGTAQAAVAQRLGMTRQALHYHVKKLEARRLLRKEAHGRETRCTISPGVEALLK